MASFDRITSNPNILNGQPAIRGMRLTVRRLIEALAVYPSWDDLRHEYPELDPEDIRQALEFAARNLDESVQPLEPGCCSNNTATECASRSSTGTRPRRGPATAKEHYEVVLAAIEAGRAEILRLHRPGIIRDEVLRTLESDLDLQELAAQAALS